MHDKCKVWVKKGQDTGVWMVDNLMVPYILALLSLKPTVKSKYIAVYKTTRFAKKSGKISITVCFLYKM